MRKRIKNIISPLKLWENTCVLKKIVQNIWRIVYEKLLYKTTIDVIYHYSSLGVHIRGYSLGDHREPQSRPRITAGAPPRSKGTSIVLPEVLFFIEHSIENRLAERKIIIIKSVILMYSNAVWWTMIYDQSSMDTTNRIRYVRTL